MAEELIPEAGYAVEQEEIIARHAAEHADGGSDDPPADGAEIAEEEPSKLKWYIIHAYSGFERKVKESLESRIRAFGLEH